MRNIIRIILAFFGITQEVTPTLAMRTVFDTRRKPRKRKGGTPGKINFRRSDPRHGMYDPLRNAGLAVCWESPRGGVLIKHKGEVISALEAFQRAGISAPKCLQNSGTSS